MIRTEEIVDFWEQAVAPLLDTLRVVQKTKVDKRGKPYLIVFPVSDQGLSEFVEEKESETDPEDWYFDSSAYDEYIQSLPDLWEREYAAPLRQEIFLQLNTTYAGKANTYFDIEVETEGGLVFVSLKPAAYRDLFPNSRMASYKDDPRWIAAKFAGVDMNGNPFRKGQQVLYYPRTKKILTGKEADKAWREFEALSFDEDFGRFASKVADRVDVPAKNFLPTKASRTSHNSNQSEGDMNRTALNLKISELIYGKAASSFLRSGDTVEKNGIRFYFYRATLVATDLTNAGKRGKKVNEVVIKDRNLNYDMASLMNAFDSAFGKNFAQVVAVFEDYAENYPVLEVYHRELRGVDVRPSDMEVLKVNGDFVTVEVDHESYTVRDKVDRNNEPTCIPAANGKKGVAVFYRWVMDNRQKIERMKYYDLLDEMHKMGIKYHNYCAMD
jgi:hypothetical protein